MGKHDVKIKAYNEAIEDFKLELRASHFCNTGSTDFEEEIEHYTKLRDKLIAEND